MYLDMFKCLCIHVIFMYMGSEVKQCVTTQHAWSGRRLRFSFHRQQVQRKPMYSNDLLVGKGSLKVAPVGPKPVFLIIL